MVFPEAPGYPAKQHYPYSAAVASATLPGPLLTIPPEVKEKILTFSKTYNKPVKPYIEIYDNEFELQHRYDPWMVPFQDPSINITGCEVTRAADASNSFIVRFFDHKNDIDKSKISTGAWVIIKCGRDALNLHGLTWGRISSNPFERGRLDASYFELVGEGTRSIIGDSMIKYSKTGELSNILNGTINPDDENSFAWKIVEDLLTLEDITLTGQNSIRDRARFDMSGFEHEVSDPITTYNIPLSDALTPIVDLAQMTGSYFTIDGNNKPHFTYGHTRHSGIKIKQYIDEEWVQGFDLGENTSYFHGSWTGNKSAVKTNGFANILVSQTGKLRQAISFSEGINGFFNLFNKDLAQQIQVDNKFVDLVIWLTKSGAGSPSKDKVHFHLIADNNGLPTGAKIATFDIKLIQVPEGGTPKPFFVSNILHNSGIVSNNEKIWFVAYEIGDSDERTVNVWHNAQFAGGNSLKSAIRPLPSGRNSDRPKHNNTAGWELINSGNGPVFAFTAMEVLDLEFVAVDGLSTRLYGEKEAPFEVPWSNDLFTTVKAMNAALYESSRPKLEYNMAEVFIPLDYYFPPVDIITIEDLMSGHTRAKSVTSRISQSTIRWDANTITTGTHWMEVLPTGFYNPVYDILDKDFVVCEA